MTVIAAVAVVATFVARGDDDAVKNQSKTNNKTIAIAPATSNRTLQEPVKSVIDHYLKIQGALADDSTNGISSNAVAIAKTVKADQAKVLDSKVADAADAVARAKDLATVRENFKDLSQSLIKYLADKKVKTGELDEVFCPMANAYWLQTNATIANPVTTGSLHAGMR